MVLPHAPVPAAIATASPATCVCICIARTAPSPDALQHTPRAPPAAADRARIARRLTLTLRVVALPDALLRACPHRSPQQENETTRRADPRRKNEAR